MNYAAICRIYILPRLPLPLGADGIRSALRPSVTGTQDGAVPAGESLYRLLVSIEDLKAQAPQHPLISPDGLLKPGISVVRTDDRKIVAYPCSGRKALNFAAFIRECR
jgi:salicylate hydroxylase